MPKFKVIEGSHIEEGQSYGKGQVVDSPLDLMALFKGKFEKVGESTPKPLPSPDPLPTAPVAESAPSAESVPVKSKKKKRVAEEKEDWGDKD